MKFYHRLPWWVTVLITIAGMVIAFAILQVVAKEAHKGAWLQSRTSSVRSLIRAHIQDHGQYPMTLDELEYGMEEASKFWGDAKVYYTPPRPDAPDGTPFLVVVVSDGHIIKLLTDDMRMVVERP